jgi:8-oxo-dGTP diphosphatase
MDTAPDNDRPLVTSDVVVFTIREGELRLLLIKRRHEPHAGRWALPGDTLLPDEDLEHAALRALAAQTGVSGVYVEQLYTFGTPDRDPRGQVVSVAHYALVPSEQLRLRAAGEAAAVGWFAREQTSDLAFDHAEIVATAHARLVAKLDYSTIAFQFLPAQFTLSELQGVYETIREEALDKRNFRKWILARRAIEETGEVRRDGSHRPARLYRVRYPGRVEIIRHERPGGTRGQPGREMALHERGPSQ